MRRSAQRSNQWCVPCGTRIEIAGLDFDREHRAALRVDVEQPAPFDDEAHFVLVVPVLAAELREHRVEVRRVGLTSMTSAVT